MTATADAPDLTPWLLIHEAMRASGDQLAAALAQADPTDARRIPALARWFVGFDGELHHHHLVEDEIIFPVLAGRVPTYQPESGGQIEVDHQRLDELLAELRGAFAAMGGGERGLALGRARAASSELAALLHRHPDLEDADVLPLVRRHFTGAEFDGLHAEASKSLSLRQARFTVPWLMSHVDEARRAELLGDAPLALRVIWRVSRRAYDRLAAAALGATTADHTAS